MLSCAQLISLSVKFQSELIRSILTGQPTILMSREKMLVFRRQLAQGVKGGMAEMANSSTEGSILLTGGGIIN